MDHLAATSRRAVVGVGLVAIFIVGLAAVALARPSSGDIAVGGPASVAPAASQPGVSGLPGVAPTAVQPTDSIEPSAPPPVAPTAAQPTESIEPSAPPPGKPTAAPVGKGKGGPLTPRLQLLADPAFAALSLDAQSRRLFLPVSGPGSLMERPGGRILVDIRVTDTSARTLGRLTASGVHLVYVDAALRTVTAEVAPAKLTALAAVQPEVLSVVEDLEPMLNAG